MVAPKSDYLLFPIACLQTAKPISEVDEQDAKLVFETCLNWHLRELAVAADLYDEDHQLIAGEIWKDHYEHEEEPTDWQMSVMYAIGKLKLDPPSDIEKLSTNVYSTRRIDLTHGASRVLVPIDLYFKARDEWTYREFAIACGVWAAIGDNPFRCVTYDKIAYHSLGYTNKKAMELAGVDIKPLTRDQLRWTLDELERRKQITRTPANRRQVAYSRSLTIDDLSRVVGQNQAEQASKRTKMSERLKKVEQYSTLSPHSIHTESTLSPQSNPH